MTALDHAAAFLRAGQPAEAVPFLRAALRERPGDAGLWHDLGVACLESGDTPAAIAALRRALALRPDFADAELRLGIALERAGEFAAALRCYEAAAARDPKALDARYRAGELLESLGDTEAAAASFRRVALEAGARTLLGRLAAARAHWRQGDHAAAERGFRAALALSPDNALALESLGLVLTETGRFDAARPILEAAVARDAARSGLYYEIARCRKLGPADAPLVAAMRAALAAPGHDPLQRARLWLALGKAEEDAGLLAAAMRAYDAAAELRAAFAPFDSARFTARIDRLIAAFPPGRVAAVAGAPARPILIVGLPRSGTTLVEQILSAHPDVAGGGELPFWNAEGLAWEASGAGDPEPLLAPAASAYLTRLGRIGKSRVTDKMPLNFQWLGLALAAVPRAIVVHCRRDLAATALSIHRTHFNPRLPFPTGGAALVAYCQDYARLMAHWRAVLPPARLVELDYETLVAAPEPTIRQLLAACGLDFHAGCLAPERNPRALTTPSKWQARRPIEAAPARDWRRFLPLMGDLRTLTEG